MTLCGVRDKEEKYFEKESMTLHLNMRQKRIEEP